MERKYDILFSISVLLKYPDDVLKIVPLDGMRLSPTPECQAHLARHNMLFKSTPGGGLIIIEKLASPSGAFQPTRPLRHPVDLTFILENTDNELLNVTEPFAGSKFESLISGRNSFACYFDNMNADLAVDTTLELSADGTSGTIKDVFFLYPEILTIPVSKASKIKTQAIAPGGAVKEFVPKSSESGYIEAVFPPGAYQVECIGGTPVGPERALIYKDFQQARALGMVRIFKDSSIDYSQQVDYTITFQKVNKNQN